MAFLLLVVLFGLWNPGELGSETLNITTYYPAPYGGYARILTTDLTLLARDSGNVGIGLSQPTSKLHLRGGRAGTIPDTTFRVENQAQTPIMTLDGNGVLRTASYSISDHGFGILMPNGGVDYATAWPPRNCTASWGGWTAYANGKFVYVRPVALIGDGAMDDWGPSAPGDALKIFCITNSSAEHTGYTGMCLTREYCPWW